MNYHLKELEENGLVELVEERRRGSVVERVYRRTGHAYAISTAALGALGTTPEERPATDSPRSTRSPWLPARSADLGTLCAGARAAGKKLPTFALEVDVRFALTGHAARLRRGAGGLRGRPRRAVSRRDRPRRPGVPLLRRGLSEAFRGRGRLGGLR